MSNVQEPDAKQGMRWIKGAMVGVCLMACILVTFLAVGDILRRRIEREKDLCVSNMRAMTVPYLCLTGLSPEDIRKIDWQHPRAVIEKIMGRPLPQCPAGGKYTVTFRNGTPGATRCVCSIHGEIGND